jgi:hypothetical protein
MSDELRVTGPAGDVAVSADTTFLTGPDQSIASRDKIFRLYKKVPRLRRAYSALYTALTRLREQIWQSHNRA